LQVPTDGGAAEAARAGRVCLEGEAWDTEGPTLREILKAIDEARRRLRDGPLTQAC
jgi:hypothetical protein